MAAAATALALSSSAARQLSRSSSTIFMREVSGSHKLTIDGYSTSRKIPPAWWETTQPFEAAGYTWRIRYFPNGNGHRKAGDDDCISLYLEFDNGGGPNYGEYSHYPGNYHHFQSTTNRPISVEFKFSLLDQAGNPVPGYTRSKEKCVFWQHHSNPPIGFDDFVKWEDLRESGCLKDDRFAIRCDITAIRDCCPDEPDSGGAPVSSVVAVPPSDLHQQLSDLLWKQKHGADVAIDVAGETFDAHGWLLAARSPVLEAELQTLSLTTSSKKAEKEKEKVLKIKGMEPKVFKAMLHFVYTDALPQPLEEDEQDGDGGVEMARGLLAAAHRYKLDRLKLMCEEALCRRLNVDTVAAILMAAEEHQCQDLKAACAEFMARPGCMKAVVATRGFEEMKATCLPLLVELLLKQLTV